MGFQQDFSDSNMALRSSYNYQMQIESKRSASHLKEQAPSSVTAVEVERNSTPTYFQLVSNDRTQSSWKNLLGAKCLISQELPHMPKHYIVQLLFDGRHDCLFLRNPSDHLVGVITYRPFKGQSFVELVFMAIGRNFKQQSFGTKLMDEFKRRMKEVKIEEVLTYADNTAVGFFSKQGFQPVIETKGVSWSGYIKEYDKGTLMRCDIHKALQRKSYKASVSQQLLAEKKNTKEAFWQSSVRYDVPQIDFHRHAVSADTLPGVLDNWWCDAKEQVFQNTRHYSLVLEQIAVLDKLRKLPSSYLLRGMTEVALQPEQGRRPMASFACMEKALIGMRGAYTHQQFADEVLKMVKRLGSAVRKGSKEEEHLRQFKEQMQPILKQLKEGTVELKLTGAFKQPAVKVRRSSR